MPRKEKAGLIGAIAVVFILVLQSIEHWTVLDAVLTGLRGMGAGGAFIVGILMSRLTPLALAIAAIILVFEGRRQKSDDRWSPVPLNATQIAAPHIEQHVHVSEKPVPQRIAPRAAVVKPAPNLTLISYPCIRIRQDGAEQGFYESNDPEDFYAIKACFRNESAASRKVAPVYGVRAAIIYRNGEKQELGNGIADACWIGDPGRIDFPLDQSHCVILAIVGGDGVIGNFYRRSVHAHWGMGTVIESYRIAEELKSIEVRLLGGEEPLIKPILFDFSLIDGKPEVRVPPLKPGWVPPRPLETP